MAKIDEYTTIWSENAETFNEFQKLGQDVHRDYVNTPGFLKCLPDIIDLVGMDLGCGNGQNT